MVTVVWCRRWVRWLCTPTDDSAHDERGMETLQFAIVIPVVLVIIMGGIQAALYFHARSAMAAAAQAGLQGSRGQQQTAGDGQAAAASFLQRAAGKIVSGPSISVAKGGGTVTVTITGHVNSVIPGIRFPALSAHASGAVDRVTH